MRAPIRIVVLDDYLGAALTSADWTAVSEHPAVVELAVVGEHLEEDALIHAIAGYDVVVAMRERSPFPARVLEQLPRLRLLVTTGMVNAAIDLAATSRLGVVVCGTGGRGPDTAELAWAMIMDLARGITAADRTMRVGGWQHGTLGRRLADRTVGVVGLGHLGGRLAGYARAFGCRVLAWSENLTLERAAEVGAERVGKADLFEQADFVSLHLQLSERTRGIVAEAELRRLGPEGFLVNTARGPLVVEDHLIQALREGWIAGAGLDTFDHEPLQEDHPLRREPRVLLTPHLGYVTTETMSVFYTEAVADVAAWLNGTPIRVLSDSTNPPVGDEGNLGGPRER